ncbi:methylase [bacterium endosymbiont of Escarpia laminata]|nr:MAG: methylase [bacterium endosymbiont of Escarpia laminata]RLJ22459.1 MAG: methylase [bacterium endosymbiont of Escarpia laminata]
MKPYAESCDQNRDPILAVIEPLFTHCLNILEIGSGTGQHAVFFARKMPHLTWHTSDQAANHEGIHLWLDEAGLPNTRPPLLLDVGQPAWPTLQIDAVFSANTTHIMHWHEVEALFSGVAELLAENGLFALYGPFNYNGRFTSDSNAGFDDWLKARDPQGGIRDFEALENLAHKGGMVLLNDYEMPGNNRILCWIKSGNG